jgi:hypothetical protein
VTTHDKAQRATVQIGPLSVDGFQMPDGSYRMSQAGAAECIGKPEINARRFLDSKGIKALRGEGYTPDSVAIESTDQSRGQSRVNALPLDVISAYWPWEASKGHQQAIALCYALMAETLERRFDAAFEVERSESARNAILAQRLQQTESALAALGDAYAEPNLFGMEVNNCGSRSLILVANLGYYRKSKIRCIIYMEN